MSKSDRMNDAAKLSPVDYIKVNMFLDRLKKAKMRMTYQEFLTLRGQAIHGDLKGAEKQLLEILEGEGFVRPRRPRRCW